MPKESNIAIDDRVDIHVAEEILGVKAQTIWKMARMNKLPSGAVWKAGSRSLRFSRAALQAYVASGGGNANAA